MEKQYRVSVQIQGDTPTDAILNLTSIFEDAEMKTMKIDWVVTDVNTGKEHKLCYSSQDLDAIAERQVDAIVDRLRKRKQP